MRTGINEVSATKSLSMRLLLSSAIAGSLVLMAGASASAQTELIVLSGDAHEWNLRASGPSAGGEDILTPFEAANDAKVVFNIQPATGLQESLQRLGPLSSTAEDIIYVHQFDTNSRLTQYLEPLDSYLDAAPIEGFPADWAPGVAAASVFDGKRYLVPIRCGAVALWYNDKLFSERGIAGPPSVPEDIYEIAKASTFVREDGEQVFGIGLRGDRWSITEDLGALARAYGGDIVDLDGNVTVNGAPVVEAVTLLKRLYKEGLMPPNWASMNTDSVTQLFKNGRVAIAIGGANYGNVYNDGESLVNGHATIMRWPLVADLKTAERDYGAGVVFYWGVGLLKGSTDKDKAVELMRHISTPASVHALANNGSGACTATELLEQAKTNPAMAVQAEIFAVSRTPLPSHTNINQIRDTLGETVQNIVVNDLDVQVELDALAERMRRLYR